MSALEECRTAPFSKERPENIDVEMARKELDTDASQSPLQPEEKPPLPPVDGGIKAWSVISGAFLALFVQFGLGEFPD
jgi:hypothetical protein